MERKNRRILTGIVVSDKCQKTITVLVRTDKKHSLYNKKVLYTKKFLAHDENSEAHMGDTVEIMETRPLSANKHFRLLRVVQKSNAAE